MWPIIVTLIGLVTFLLYIQRQRKNPPKIFGVYARPGKWHCLKFFLFYSLLQLRRFKSKLMEKKHKEEAQIKELERLQPLSSHEKAFDAVFFQAVNMDGYYICGGNERRHQAKTSGLFYIGVPGLGLLGSEKLPYTLLQTDSVSIHQLKEYSAEGIRFTPVKPMMLWKISYDGKMKLENEPTRRFQVKLEANWVSTYPYFLYEKNMNNKALARAVAQETWTREFFDTLRESHQTHYEQMGFLRGTLTLDGKKHELHMSAFRDHSFGFKRDWSLLHRYAFHMLYLKNGTRIVIGVISYPSTMSHFAVGYVVHSNKSIDSVEECDLKLYQHGENGKPGREIAFCIVANKKPYAIKVNVVYEAVHYKGADNEAKLIERFLKCEVNGVEGRGIAEWHYNVQ